jgi:hypothetical protein
VAIVPRNKRKEKKIGKCGVGVGGWRVLRSATGAVTADSPVQSIKAEDPPLANV